MSDPETPSTDPIDAEFEPAEDGNGQHDSSGTTVRPVKNHGPGWLSLLFVMLISFGALGLSLWSSGLLEKGLKPNETDTGLAAMSDQQSALAERLDTLEGEIADISDALETAQSDIASLETSASRQPEPQEGPTPAAIESRITDLETQLANQPEPAPSVDPQRIAELEAAIQAAGDQDAPTSAELARLRQQVTGLQSEIAQLSNTQSTLSENLSSASTQAETAGRQALKASQTALAIASIENAIAAGGPFEAPARRLAALLPSNQNAERLAALSSRPVPGLDRLERDFLALRDTALDLDSQASGEPGWVDSVFGDFVSVRRGNRDSAVPATLNTATTSLERGNLEEAVAAVDSLPDTSRSVYDAWLADARRRIQAVQAIGALRLEFIEQTP
ncbi:COG4223 family protein [Henriciella marina]|uniref:COG4223 family protein n=1 Tax=Henriciella marina TaxID=453851 RepID=UPI000380BAAB|nr:mitofilin family membrane protein [Henriciella marina]